MRIGAAGQSDLRFRPESRPVSIAILSNSAESLYNFRGDLIRSLTEKGMRVYSLAPDYDAASRARLKDLGAVPVDIALDRNGTNIVRDLICVVNLYRILRGIRPDVFFGYFMKPVIYGGLAAWFARVPRRVVMVAGLGYVFIDNGRNLSWKFRVVRSLVTRLYSLVFHRVDKVIFQNPDDMALMLEAGVATPDRTVLIDGSGVNLEHFKAKTKVPRAGGRLSFIWTGRLLREKGVAELVEATQIVRERGHRIEVIVVGGLDSNPGSLREEEVSAWHDAGVINWTGKVDDVRPWLERADVFVLPSSYREGVPRSTQEAMAMGLAVITTDAPGCRETVEDGLNGFLVPVRSSAALADAMIRYVENPDLAARHGQASLELVARKFDVKIINRKMLEFLIPAAPVE